MNPRDTIFPITAIDKSADVLLWLCCDQDPFRRRARKRPRCPPRHFTGGNLTKTTDSGYVLLCGPISPNFHEEACSRAKHRKTVAGNSILPHDVINKKPAAVRAIERITHSVQTWLWTRSSISQPAFFRFIYIKTYLVLQHY